MGVTKPPQWTRFSRRFSQQRPGTIFAEMLICLLLIGAADFATSYHIRLLPFYAGPIFAVAWFCGSARGIVAAFVAGIIWCFSNWLGGDPELHTWILLWEICRHFIFFLVVASLGAALRAKDEMANARIALLERTQQLEHDIVGISQAEQRRIGQNLHDGLCQYLAALTCSATSLRDDLQKSSLVGEAETAARLAKHLEDAVVQARDLAHELVPAHVAQLGLVPALESLAQSVSRLHAIDCTFELHGEAKDCCDGETGMHLYRIAQEAIQNATRHGRAGTIALSLHLADSLIRFRIADNGVGMSDWVSDGMGLALMRYRARIAGGELTVEQPEEGGTVISCTAKMKPKQNEPLGF